MTKFVLKCATHQQPFLKVRSDSEEAAVQDDLKNNYIFTAVVSFGIVGVFAFLTFWTRRKNKIPQTSKRFGK
jgi:hypothetical protein